MNDRNRFTEEELALAKTADLTAVASALGYTVRRVGKYHTLKEMDSIRIYNRSHWFRWSRRYEGKDNGGSQIDFLRVFGGIEVKEAVFWLLDFMGYSKAGAGITQPVRHQVVGKETEETKEFILPQRASDNRFLYGYLENDRGISKEVIDLFVTRGLIYESRAYHNIVFLGNDKEGKPKFASMRGVFDRNGRGFKCDVGGNDKRFGFNVRNPGSRELAVFEAAIDLMSYVDLTGDRTSNLLALGMVSDAPLETFLKENPQIEVVRFGLDNDGPGRKASEQLKEKYFGLGYEVEDISPPVSFKDYNEWLLFERKKSVNPGMREPDRIQISAKAR
ncbi:MAG: DUF3991 and TOPRIM domain-containing protein [Eubacterium sp.]|nr:DUF3991 and TOPRIM domain-containing protein [Eubacterium sp.]